MLLGRESNTHTHNKQVKNKNTNTTHFVSGWANKKTIVFTTQKVAPKSPSSPGTQGVRQKQLPQGAADAYTDRTLQLVNGGFHVFILVLKKPPVSNGWATCESLKEPCAKDGPFSVRGSPGFGPRRSSKAPGSADESPSDPEPSAPDHKPCLVASDANPASLPRVSRK